MLSISLITELDISLLLVAEGHPRKDSENNLTTILFLDLLLKFLLKKTYTCFLGARKQLPNRLYPADARNIAENSAKNSSESQKKRNRFKVKNRSKLLTCLKACSYCILPHRAAFIFN